MHRFFTIRKFFTNRAPGQSIVVIAFMIVVLIGFVGLAVDVGNAYGQQRRVQSGVDAAAVVGMLAVQDNTTNSAVLGSIKAAMQGHGFLLSDTQHYSWQAFYIVPDISHPGQMMSKDISTQTGSAAPPNGIVNVSVKATATVDSYFAKVIGRPNLPAHAVGFACNAASTNVYPISVPYDLSADTSANTQYNPATWNTTTHTGPVISPANSAVWTVGSIWGFGTGNGKNGSPGVHVGYWHFNSNGSNSASTLDAQMAAPGSFHQGSSCGGGDNCYLEDSPQGANAPVAPYTAATQQNNKIEPYDYVSVYPGVKSSVLNGSNFTNHMTAGDTMILPMTSTGGGNGANGWLQIQQLGSFKLMNNNNPTFQYLGPVLNSSPVSCSPADTAGIQ